MDILLYYAITCSRSKDSSAPGDMVINTLSPNRRMEKLDMSFNFLFTHRQAKILQEKIKMENEFSTEKKQNKKSIFYPNVLESRLP